MKPNNTISEVFCIKLVPHVKFLIKMEARRFDILFYGMIKSIKNSFSLEQHNSTSWPTTERAMTGKPLQLYSVQFYLAQNVSSQSTLCNKAKMMLWRETQWFPVEQELGESEEESSYLESRNLWLIQTLGEDACLLQTIGVRRGQRERKDDTKDVCVCEATNLRSETYCLRARDTCREVGEWNITL